MLGEIVFSARCNISVQAKDFGRRRIKQYVTAPCLGKKPYGKTFVSNNSFAAFLLYQNIKIFCKKMMLGKLVILIRASDSEQLCGLKSHTWFQLINRNTLYSRNCVNCNSIYASLYIS